MNNFLRYLCSPVAAVFLLSGCRQDSTNHEPSPALAEPYTSVSGAVGFDISAAQPLTDGTQVWNAIYPSDSGDTKFQIQLPHAKEGKEISFTKGKLVAVQGSKPKALLQALKIALEAKRLPEKPRHVASISFTGATLGVNMSRMKDGGFSETPPGTWWAIKIFLPCNDGEDCEVFLNLSPATHKGEFSIKDSDYGDEVLADLAQIL